MAETAVIETPETGAAPEVDTAPAVETKVTESPETQVSEGPNHQPDSGVPADIANGVPQEPDNVQKVETDGSLNSSIDGKVPEGLDTKEEWLHTILEKEKSNPETDFSEDELDILDEYYEGRLKPKEFVAKIEKQETDSEDENPDADAENSNDDGSIESVLKEVGAKDQKQLLGKIKDLRKFATGKVKGSPEFKQLQAESKDVSQRLQNEFNLMEDVQKGIPEAIAHFEKAYNVKLERPGQPEPKQKQETQSEDSDLEYLDETAGKEISGLKSQVKELIGTVKELKGATEKTEEKFAGERVEASIVDEMVQVAERVNVLKEIPNLRQ